MNLGSRWPFTGLLPAVLVGTGCASSDVSTVSVVDSAGVTITASAAPRWLDGGWQISDRPVLDLATAGEGPDHEFFQVSDVTRLSDGSIVVANRGTAEVRRYSSEGRLLARTGREGEGPGEFQRLTSVSETRGDSVLAYDYWPGRLTVLDGQLSLGRIATKPASVVRIQDVLPLSGEVLLGVISDFTAMEGVSGLMRLPNVLVRLGMDLEVLDTVAVVPGYETFVFETGDARPVLGRQTFVRVHDGRVLVGTGDGLEYRIYSDTGALSEIVRVPTFDLSLSSAVLEEERSRRLPDNASDRRRRIEERIPNPDTRPGYSNLVVDQLGYVWARWYPTRAEMDDALEWQVFDPSGEWLGPVQLPPRFAVFEIGEEYVLGERQDELGVSHVQVLELSRLVVGATGVAGQPSR